MKIICAPDKFKESLTAMQAAQAMRAGVLDVLPGASVDLCPVADGGEGTVESLVNATQGQWQTTHVHGPRGAIVEARWGLLGPIAGEMRIAVIEMAAASGLALLTPDQRDPAQTSTFGTGELVKAALDAGAQRIILGIGGSATNDAGCGAAQALGVQFIDVSGETITQHITGSMLTDIVRIDISSLDARLRNTQIIAACDVRNPLTGENGAAFIYAPQKGAAPARVAQLDAGLKHIAALMRTQLGRDVEHVAGAGAAGGLGAGLLAFAGASLQPGIDLVLDAVGFDRRVAGCDLCLTGEGRLDGQSLSGKACLGVAAAAKRQGVPTIALVGSIGPDAQRAIAMGLTAYHVIGEGLSREESIRRAGELLRSAAARVISRIQH